MLKNKILLTLVLLSFAFAAGAETFKVKNVFEGKRTIKTREKSSNKFLWQSEIWTQKIKGENGEQFLYLEENGSGIYGSDKKNKNWKTIAYFRVMDNSLVPYQVKQDFKDKNGKVIKTIEKIYDSQKKKAICKIDGKYKTFEFKNDLVDKEMLGVIMGSYPFAEKRDFIFHLLTHEPTLYKITLKYRGQESLTLGSSEIECYKLEMIPDLGALNIFGAFVPKTYFWLTVKSPHTVLRYEGLESGLNTPYIIIDTAI